MENRLIPRHCGKGNFEAVGGQFAEWIRDVGLAVAVCW